MSGQQCPLSARSGQALALKKWVKRKTLEGGLLVLGE
jgi:hypothetical protein